MGCASGIYQNSSLPASVMHGLYDAGFLPHFFTFCIRNIGKFKRTHKTMCCLVGLHSAFQSLVGHWRQINDLLTVIFLENYIIRCGQRLSCTLPWYFSLKVARLQFLRKSQNIKRNNGNVLPGKIDHHRPIRAKRVQISRFRWKTLQFATTV